MSTDLFVPEASASAEDHADCFEFAALKNGRYSIQDFGRGIRRSGTAEDLGDPEAAGYRGDIGGEKSETVAEDAFGAIEDRLRACGEEAYPFEVKPNYLTRRETGGHWVYIFLLLLSKFGKDAGPRGANGAKLFEEVCGAAAQSYFGGPDEQFALVGKKIFGFPRKEGTGFKKAVDSLCREMGEGDGIRPRSKLSDYKDDKLDIVVWRNFLDKRPGKLVGFGQCATGGNWESKKTELQPLDFCHFWMKDSSTISPVKMFFVPHRVERNDWKNICSFSGILFDRCRITYHAQGLDQALMKSCIKWSRHVLNGEVTG